MTAQTRSFPRSPENPQETRAQRRGRDSNPRKNPSDSPAGRTGATWTEKDGRKIRRCCRCGKAKRLKSGFYVNSRKGKTVEYGRRCKPCEREHQREEYQRRRTDLQRTEAERARHRESLRAWRKANPERAKEMGIRYRAKVKADPIRHAEMAEKRRIYERMRAEQEGRKPRASFENVLRIPESRHPRPVAPLVEVMLDMHSHGFEIEELCEKAGITSRTFRRWRTGEIHDAKLAVAERAALGLGLDAEVLWPDVEGVAA